MCDKSLILATTLTLAALWALPATLATAATAPDKTPPASTATPANAAAPTAAELDEAIITVRRCDPAKEEDYAHLRKAADTLIAGRAASREKIRAALVQEIAKDKTQDQAFRILMTALLWQIGRMDEVDAVTQSLATAELTANFDVAYRLAIDLAGTHDVRVLPALRPFLRAKKGAVAITVHFMKLAWPVTVDYLWGIAGPDTMPYLRDLLNHSTDQTEIAAALYILARMADTDSLPKARELLGSQDPLVRTYASMLLGRLGHPDDFQRLCDLVKEPTQENIFIGASALYDFGDRRAVPLLIPLLEKAQDRPPRIEVLVTLRQLLTPEGLRAIRELKPINEADEEVVQNLRDALSRGLDTDLDAFGRLPAEQQAATINRKLQEAREHYEQLQPNDRRLTHAELLAACREWIARNRIRGGTYAWVEDRHVLSVATAADIPLLLQVRGAVLSRLSDEMLSENEILERLIIHLAQRGYRKTPGVCSQVERP